MERKSEKYMINLYLDNENHMLALKYIEKNLKYAHILHDKDISIENRRTFKATYTRNIIIRKRKDCKINK